MSVVQRVFGRNQGSRHVAKARLTQVIAHDRARISPGKLQHLREDLIRTLTHHIDIDPESLRVELLPNGREIHLDARVALRRTA